MKVEPPKDGVRDKIEEMPVGFRISGYDDKMYLAYDSIDEILALIKLQQEALTDRVIKYIRSGEVAGSFSEGCDCEKCDAYEKKVKTALNKLRLEL